MKQKPCVLIADDDKDLVNALAGRCKRLGLEVVTAYRGLSAFNAVVEHRPDVVCLDVNMPAGNGLGICEMLADDPVAKKIPVIILTGNSEPQTIRRCHDLCAYYVQKCPDVWQRIEPLLRELLKLDPRVGSSAGSRNELSKKMAAAPPQTAESTAPADSNMLDAVFAMLGTDAAASEPAAPPAGVTPEDATPWILHIEDDQDLSAALSLRLLPYGISVIRAFSGMEGYRHAFLHPAEAIILDVELPNGQGDYVLRRLKENPVTKDIPVIVLTGKRERTVERQMMNLGADAYLTKPLNFNALLAQLERFLTLRKERVEENNPSVEREVSLAGAAT